MADPSRSRIREVAGIAAPVVLGQLSSVLVSFSDAFMVGRLEGVEGARALAALGACSTPFLVAFLVFSSIAQGVQIISSRRLGEQRDQEIGAVLTSGLAIALGVGVIASAVGWLISPFIAAHMTEDPATAELAREYLQLRWGGGMWLVVLAFCFRGFYWGTGLTRTDLFVSVVFNLSNIFLNWVLIYGNLGVTALGAPGAGAASAMANGISVLLLLALTLRPSIRKRFGPFRPGSLRWSLGRRILRLSIPRALQAMAFSVSIAFFALIHTMAGDAGLAASAVIWRFVGFTVVIAIGIGTAASTLVGRELGAKRPEQAAEYGRAAVIVAMIAVGTIALIGILLARPILAAFFGTEREALVELALPVFRLMLTFQVIDAIGIVLARSLQGAGDVLYVMYAEFAVAWGTCLPVALLGGWWLADSAPLLGVWIGWSAYTAAWALAMVLRWRGRRWTKIKI